MNARDINRDNLVLALEETLEECKGQLDLARSEVLIQEFKIAIEALQGIKSELDSEMPKRPKQLRTGLFIRYAIDINDKFMMDEGLRSKIVRIEDIYKRL